MSYRTSVYITHHNSMVVFLGSNSVLPKSYRNVVTKNLEILNASYVSVKLPTQLFAAPKLLNC
ncbi:hypothetical protein GCM10007963_30840 [Lutibacter litoralis]|nr:hypothetical protein GCM10007963_30840 [Lutibacter litoralis]